MSILNRIVITTLMVLASMSSFGDALGWTDPYIIKYIDSGTASKNNVLITLDGYENTRCSGNRVSLSSDDDQKFNQMISMVLGAFYAGKKVDFYLNNSSNCNSNRVFVYK